MFERILPDNLLRIVNEYAQPSRTYGTSPIDVFIVHNLLGQPCEKFDAREILFDLCRRGDPELFDWFCEQPIFQTCLANRFAHSLGTSHFLRIACVVGNMHIIQRLIDLFGFDTIDVRALDDFCLVALCYNGHIDVAIRLIEKYGIDKIADAKKKYCYNIGTTMCGEMPYQFDPTILATRSIAPTVVAVNIARSLIQ